MSKTLIPIVHLQSALAAEHTTTDEALIGVGWRRYWFVADNLAHFSHLIRLLNFHHRFPVVVALRYNESSSLRFLHASTTHREREACAQEVVA